MNEPAASLDSFFAPSAIAILGASPDTTKIRGLLLHMLRKNGYAGRLFPVNPSYPTIDGIRCFPSVAAIGEAVDLALVAIPAAGVPAALEECAAAGVRHAVIISSGFAEGDSADPALQMQIAELARRTGMRISGPNAEGFHNEIARVSATFSPAVESTPGEVPIAAVGGRIGIVAQSGGIGFSFYNRGRALGLAFSTIVTTGNETDLTAADFFDHLARDDTTSVILLFIETVRDPAAFIAAAERAAAAGKPVVTIKVGRSPAGERAAASHTASMAGGSAAYDAVAKSCGMIPASDPDEALAIAAVLATAPPPKGSRVAVVTVSGGAGAWAADALAAHGLEVPELGPELQRTIAGFIPPYGSARNPVDITAQAVHSGGLTRAIELLNGSDEIDAILVAISLAREHRVSVDAAQLRTIVETRAKPVVFYSYTLPSVLARNVLAEGGAVIHTGLAHVANALRAALWRARWKPTQRPAATPNTSAARAVRNLLGTTARTFCEYEAKRALAAFGIALPPERLVTNAAELERAAAAVGYPLALKLQSPDLLHKTEVGGVALGLADPATLGARYRAMMETALGQRPQAKITGVLLAPMARPGTEMIVGAVRDRAFGPIVMVGAGGTLTELFGDAAYRLAPVDEAGARDMLRELKSLRLLEGFRGGPPADIEALAALVAAVSRFAAAFRDLVREVEINPVVVHPAGEGCTVVDALLVTEPEP